MAFQFVIIINYILEMFEEYYTDFSLSNKEHERDVEYKKNKKLKNTLIVANRSISMLSEIPLLAL